MRAPRLHRRLALKKPRAEPFPLTERRGCVAFSLVQTSAPSPAPETGGLLLRPPQGELRIAPLDGMRGIAVLMVMYFHLLPDAAWPAQLWIKKAVQTGFGSGVDLFFVLSGFLITGILLDGQGSPHYFRNFYMRRMLRIFPLYYGVLALVFGILPGLGLVGGASFDAVRSLSPWHWAYLSNVVWFLHPFALDSPQIDLRHFWSLAIEEHFYLFWPWIVGFSSPRSLRRICLAVFGASLACRLGWALESSNAFSLFVFLTPCRLDALAAGGFLAALTHEKDWRKYLPAAKAVFFLSALLLVALVLRMRGHGEIRSLSIALVAVMLASGILVALHWPSNAWGARVLGSRFLVFFGKYSYGLYVIHGLLVPFLQRHLPEGAWIAAMGSNLGGGLAVATAKIAVTVPLAMLSWHLYEKQFLKLKRYFH